MCGSSSPNTPHECVQGSLRCPADPKFVAESTLLNLKLLSLLLLFDQHQQIEESFTSKQNMFSCNSPMTGLCSLMPYCERHTWFFRWPDFLVLAFLCGITTFVLLGLYNRYFHPLRNIPGPVWSSVTDLYKLFVLSSHNVTELSLELHEKYGESETVNP